MIDDLKKVGEALTYAVESSPNFRITSKCEEALTTRDAIIARLESEELVEEVASIIADMADRNMLIDENNEPILYNEAGIAEAAINAIKGK